jgi:hypothetical protein
MRRSLLAAFLALITAVVGTPAAGAAVAKTARMSISSGNVEGNKMSYTAFISTGWPLRRVSIGREQSRPKRRQWGLGRLRPRPAPLTGSAAANLRALVAERRVGERLQ